MTKSRQQVAQLLGTLGDLVAPIEPVLARVWLVGPGDICDSCPMRRECPNRTRCLHLEASSGITSRVDGPFRRFPLGARQVGRVYSERRALVANRDLERLELADSLWISLHQVRGFAAVPLLRSGECVGVLAVFSRRELSETDVRGLAAAAELLAQSAALPPSPDSHPTPVPLRSLAAIEREAIERTLAATGGRVSGPRGAAMILGLKPTTLHSRMRKLGIRRLPR